MELLIGVSFLILGVLLLGFIFLRRQQASTLMSGRSSFSLAGNSEGGRGSKGEGEARAEYDTASLNRLKREQRRKKKTPPLTLEQRMFKAGLFSQADRDNVYRLRVLAPLIGTIFFGAVVWYMTGIDLLIVGIILGAFMGLQAPNSYLERKAKKRDEEIMYYLPLVIEQIAIGVSSSLDIGPCIQRVVSMADERDTHNPVTELIKIAHNHVRSGASLDEALTEVGILSGHTELKHTFMSLAQVVRHGGEITRQLQELADSVSSQRENRIEGVIKRLELVATGPVALVFIGFMTIILVGFGLQIGSAFG
jgi:Flp pilus assembly protein TadB